MGGGGKSRSQVVGYWYKIGLHFGICHGPVDAVQEIKIGERVAWGGDVKSSNTVYINNRELFGGKKREGGVQGYVDLLFGNSSQSVNSYLASKLGSLIPAYRGILSAVYRGGYISANNPYIKPWSFRVKRVKSGWNTPVWNTAKADVAGCSRPGSFQTQASMAIYIAADHSGSMSGTRLTNQKNSINGFLESLKTEINNGQEVDVMFVAWSCSASTITRRNCTAANIDEIKNFVNSGVASGGTCFNTAVSYASSFFSSSPSGHIRISIFTSDGEPTDSAATAGATLLAIPNIYSFCFNIDLANTTSAALLDNTASDGVPVVSGGSSDALRNAIVTALADLMYKVWQGDMNAVHIVYQCLTDPVWGMGYPTSAIDETSFLSAANTAYIEGFGLAMLWNQQDSIENFITEVLDHVGGILYVKPDTGKFALKLIRGDYSKPSLPLYNETNIVELEDYERQAWGDTINELTLIYVDGLYSKETSVTVQDLANIQTQGGVVNKTVTYNGIRCPEMAARVATRDLLAHSTPIARAKLTVNRTAWAAMPGDVIRVTWPELGIADVVYRVLEVNKGTLQDGTITATIVEDVFSLPSNSYIEIQESEWEAPDLAPTQIGYKRVLEAPYYELATTLPQSELAYISSDAGYLTAFAGADGSNNGFTLHTKTGVNEYREVDSGGLSASATLTSSVNKTATSWVISGLTDGDKIEIGNYAIVNNEYVKVVSFNEGTNTVVVGRGVLDTVPQDHASGSTVLFNSDVFATDSTEYATNETVEAKLLPYSTTGTLSLDAITPVSITMNQRFARPYPPGKLRVNGQVYPATIGGSTALSLSWAHRDRVQQTAGLVDQEEGNIGPEAGTTYRVRIYGENNTLIHTESNITGTSYTYLTETEALLLGRLNGSLRFQLEAVRDLIASLYYHEHTVLRHGGDFNMGVFTDITPPTTTITSGSYTNGAITLTGTNFNTLGVPYNTDVKGNLNWTKFTVDINGDNATTADKTFVVGDIASATPVSSTNFVITLTSSAKTALESMSGFGNAIPDTLDIQAGFIKDAAGNAATTDAVSNAPFTIA